MNKKLISFLLIFSLLPALFVPASASSISSDNSEIQYSDLLTGTSYTWSWWSDSYRSNGYTTDPLFTFNSANSFQVTWTPRNFAGGYDYMIFCLRADHRPYPDVRVSFGDEFGFVSAEFEGRIEYTDQLNYYFYRVPMETHAHDITIAADIDYYGAYSGVVSIFNCYGANNITSYIDRAPIVVQPFVKDGSQVLADRKDDKGTQMFPFNYRNDTTSDLHSVDVTLRLASKRFNSSAIGNVSVLLTTYCKEIIPTVALVEAGKDLKVANIKATLQEINAFGAASEYEHVVGASYVYTAFQLNFDLSGYDMSKYDVLLYFQFEAEPYDPGGSIKTKLLEFTFQSVSYIPVLATQAWYTPIVDVFRSIGNWFASLDDTIGNLTTSIGDWFYNLFDKWDSAWSTLFEKMEHYFGEDGEMADKADEMEQQANQMQQANDAMNSVAKPSVDAGGMLDQYLNFNPTGLAILSVITGNPFATSMLVVIFTFALCGYIFFGKKR